MDVKSVIEKNIVIVMKKRPNKASSFFFFAREIYILSYGE